MYFVSETDMLKAMRSALLDEVIRADDIITGQHFGDLHNFVSLLAEASEILKLFSCLQKYLLVV